MNAIRFDTYLANAVSDPTGTVYPPSARALAAQEAVRAYSRYVPLTRPIGSGAVWQRAASGQNVILSVGTIFTPGQQIVIDPTFPWNETVTVQSIAPYPDSGPNAGNPLQITLTGNLVGSHEAGALIYGVNPLSTGQATIYNGLNTIIGQAQYQMPLDFLDVERDTFDVAIGLKPLTRADTFYSPYPPTEALSGVGIGQTMQFGFSLGWLGWPTGWQANAGAGLLINQPWETEAVFTGDQYQVLNITPFQSVVTLQFLYYAQQQLETVSDSNIDVLCGYAEYFLYSSQG